MTAGLGRRRENVKELHGASAAACVMYCTIADGCCVPGGERRAELLRVSAATV